MTPFLGILKLGLSKCKRQPSVELRQTIAMHFCTFARQSIALGTYLGETLDCIVLVRCTGYLGETLDCTAMQCTAVHLFVALVGIWAGRQERQSSCRQQSGCYLPLSHSLSRRDDIEPNKQTKKLNKLADIYRQTNSQGAWVVGTLRSPLQYKFK